MMDSYSAKQLDNPTPRHACTRRVEMIGRDNLHTVQDIICYIKQVGPEYAGIQPPRGHLSGPGSHCTYRGLELLKATPMLESLE
jgi:hypothetical protein